MDPDPGLLSGRYRLGRLLGRGGMADVYDGFDERLARPVAVKILRSAADDDPALRFRFEREARSVARLSHPAVVAVFDSGEDHGRAYLVMERLPGETLADRIRLGPVDPRWLVPVLVDVLGALAAAHALGMVHRDIKPANILLVGDGRAKVADFGIAKIYQDSTATDDDTGRADLTATGLILGTVAYLSPEQIGGAPASPQADIYAVGVVAYEALAGRKPFVGDNAIAQAHAVAEGRTSDLAAGRPDVDPRLAAVVRGAMARRVEDRYPSAVAMLADLVATGLGDGDRSDRDDATVALPPPFGASAAGGRPRSGEEPGSVPTVAMGVPPPIDATRILPPVGPRPGPPPLTPPPSGPPPLPLRRAGDGGRRRGGLIGALVALAVVVVAAAVVALLVSRNNGSKTIPPASTTPTTVSPTTAAAAVTVPATTTTSTSTTSTSTTSTSTTSTTAVATTTSTTALPTTTAPTTTTTPSDPTTATTAATTAVTTPAAAGLDRSTGRPRHGRRHG
jgi:serine/threonine protein kinase